MRSDLAVLFDLDGVLVDSWPYHLPAWEQLARERALAAPAGYFTRTFGLRNDAILGGFLPGLTAEQLRELSARKEELFRAKACGRLRPLPGAADLLAFLDDQEVPKAVVTSTPRENLDMILSSLSLPGRFQALVAEEDAARGKPDPEGFLVAARRLGVDPHRCFVIDAPAGIEAAKRAGMRAIALATTHPFADLAEADLAVESLTDDAVRTFIFGG